MIGRQLVDLLLYEGARVRIASLDNPSRAHPDAEFMKADLTLLDSCKKACKNIDYVFNLLGVKGSPAVVQKFPANMLTPMLQFNTNLLRAAREANAGGYLFTSSIGVYYPAEVLKEDDVWKTPSPPNDLYAGHAKRTGELEVMAYKIQYGWDNVAIVRPANVYGPYDNFESKNSMVIPSLIKKAVNKDGSFIVFGDGSAIRDFIHARDVARGMIMAAEKAVLPLNLGSGKGASIKKLVQTILSNLDKKPKVVWDTSKPQGDKKRVLDISKAADLGFRPEISLEQGIKETMEWYIANQEKTHNRYDIFDNK